MNELKPSAMTDDERLKLIAWLESRAQGSTMPGASRMYKLALDAIRAQPSNKPLTLEQLREMRGGPLWKEEPPSGDMTESEIEPVLFSGIHCGKEERACWVTCEAHHANALIEHIAAGKINFYRRKPEGSPRHDL